MYNTLTRLQEETVAQLEALMGELNLSQNDIRPGMNAPEVMSVYKHSKWYDWNRLQKNKFKELLGSEVDKAVVGWYLSLPVNGFMDKMDYWQQMVSAGTVVAYSLTDNNSIIVGDSTVTLQRGEGIKFHLKELHEIKVANFERNWACLMQLV